MATDSAPAEPSEGPTLLVEASAAEGSAVESPLTGEKARGREPRRERPQGPSQRPIQARIKSPSRSQSERQSKGQSQGQGQKARQSRSQQRAAGETPRTRLPEEEAALDAKIAAIRAANADREKAHQVPSLSLARPWRSPSCCALTSKPAVANSTPKRKPRVKRRSKPHCAAKRPNSAVSNVSMSNAPGKRLARKGLGLGF